MSPKEFDVNRFARRICHDERTLEMFRYFVNNAYLRIIRYNSIPKKDSLRFEAEIRYYQEHFSFITPHDISAFFNTSKWSHKKPCLLLCFLGGYRNQYDVVLPILEKYGFHGWFFITPGFIETPVKAQTAYAMQHGLEVSDAIVYPDNRIALDWDEVTEIGRKHTLCANPFHNTMIDKSLSDDELLLEIVQSKERLEAHTQQKVIVFHWLSAEEYNYNVRAHRMLENAGYQYVLSNLKLERIQ